MARENKTKPVEIRLVMILCGTRRRFWRTAVKFLDRNAERISERLQQTDPFNAVDTAFNLAHPTLGSLDRNCEFLLRHAALSSQGRDSLAETLGPCHCWLLAFGVITSTS